MPRKRKHNDPPWDAGRRDRGGGSKKLMDEDKWASQRAENDLAAAEGRTLYVRGMPPSWTNERLEEFFSHQGEVTGSHLLPQRSEQPGRAGFVNFASKDDTLNAAQVCDNLKVDDEDGTRFTLVCSIKQALGKKVSIVSGFTELSKAKQEKRAAYISGMPSDTTEAEVRELLSPCGRVQGVHFLPGTGRNASMFALMASKEEVENLIVTFDGQVVRGRTIMVSFPMPPKQTRNKDKNSVVEIRGYPPVATALDLQAAIEARGFDVQTVKVLRHDSLSEEGVAVAYLNSAQDAKAVIKDMNNFEWMSGYVLSVALKVEPENEGSRALYDAPGPDATSSAPKVFEPGAKKRRLMDQAPRMRKWDLAPANASAAPFANQPGVGAPRVKGRLVGRLSADGPLAWDRML